MTMDLKIKDCLKRAVKEADLDVSTLADIRKVVIGNLELAPDFFKQSQWKKKSAEIIDEAISARLSNDKVRQEEEEIESNYCSSNDSEVHISATDEKPKPESKSKTTVKTSGSKSLKLYEKNIKHSSTKNRVTKKEPTSSDNKVAKLKSQLLKCGIRRQWAKLLDPLPDEKARIAYLQDQLTKVGMTGRFSEVKAKKIKQQREMEKEISELNESANTFTKGLSRKVRKIAVSDDEEN